MHYDSRSGFESVVVLIVKNNQSNTTLDIGVNCKPFADNIVVVEKNLKKLNNRL